jgi:hypothetical protein
MSDYYVYGHVKNWEAKKFEKYTMIERQVQYIRVVSRHHPKYGIKKLINILNWKFGLSILDIKIIKEIRNNNKWE